jgi:hypothetical protein
MLYPELDRRVKSGEIMVGDLVWVTSYYYNNPSTEKPTRHVPPTLVQVTSNHDLACRTSLSSGYHFRPCGKSGKLLSKVILPYEGSAGNERSTDRGSIHIFLIEEEARSAYVAAANVVKSQFAEVLRIAVETCAQRTAGVDERIVAYK